MSKLGVLDPRSGAEQPPADRKGERAGLISLYWQPHAEMSFAQWVEQGRKLGLVGRSVGWWIGDWLHYGNVAYGERYVRAARLTGLDVQTLMNMVYVASHFEPSRRRDTLSWSHHAELAALEPGEQEKWLDQAERERLSVRCLREEIRRERRACLTSGHEAGVSRRGSTSRDDVAIVCPSCGHAFAHDDEPQEAVDVA